MKLKRKHPCGECPFRQESMKGWLGPWTLDSILQQVHAEVPGHKTPGLACHLDVAVQLERKEDISNEELYEKSHVCVGSLHHANASFKRYKHPELNVMAAEVGLLSTILDLFKFRKHHGGE